MRAHRRSSKLAARFFWAVLFLAVAVETSAGGPMRSSVVIKGKTESKRTKPEFLSFRLGGGNYGAYGQLSIGTLRWRYFYFDIVRIFGGGGARSDHSDRQFFSGIGIGLGFPWHLDFNGKHEIRIGTGIGSGIVSQYNYCEEANADGLLPQEYCYYRQQGFGLIFTPEIYYVWHSSPAVGIQIGVDMNLATHPNKIQADPPDADRIEFIFPSPAVNGFFGVRF